MEQLAARSFASVMALALLGCADDGPIAPDRPLIELETDSRQPLVDARPVDPIVEDTPLRCARPRDPSWSSAPARPPASLGDGLVHDARLSPGARAYSRHAFTGELTAGVSWSGFVGRYSAMRSVGFRPVQVRATVSSRYADDEAAEIEIVDRSVYVSDDAANYRTEVATYLFADAAAERTGTSFAPAAAGARPTSIELVSLAEGGALELGYSLAWVYDEGTIPWKLRVGLDASELDGAIDELALAGYRPISISSRARAGASEYAAIFVADGTPTADWDLTLGLEPADLGHELRAAWEQGWYPARISAEQGSWARLDILWAARAPGLAVELRLNLDEDGFREQDASLRKQGYHLESFERYDDAGEPRHVGVWLRYRPCLRWTGTEFRPSSAAYHERYAMFHEQALATMTLAGTANEGRALRPSATLHIFEGDELVLDRAYTYAPAIYPDTPLDAPMKLASVSKSLTAAAVVQRLDELGLPRSSYYTQLAWLPEAPEEMHEVRIIDVLRNLGGFRAERGVYYSLPHNPTSYLDHRLIDASPWGGAPIDGQELFAYVVDGGHLGGFDADSYWDAERFHHSRDTLSMHYSNPGYTMLGELVARISGIPYEQYVRERLAAPLGLEDRLFADPGHRKRARGPSLAGFGTYLINADHPYRFVPADAETPVEEPRFGAQPLPWAAGSFGYTDSVAWGPTVGPVDPTAPEYANTGRYAGSVYMGGAPLAAGGWHGDGEAIGRLIRAVNQGEELLSAAEAKALGSMKNIENWRAEGWSYGLGTYVRGNWVAWAGGAEGSMATVLHNRFHDFTVVFLANAKGNGLAEFINPLMGTVSEWEWSWGTSRIGQVFPCEDEFEMPGSDCWPEHPAEPY